MDADVVLESVFIAEMYADYRQTKVIAENPQKYYENNLILGLHPSKDRTALYFAAAAIAHIAVTYTIPKGKYRTGFQAISIAVEVSAISTNLKLGIGF